MAAMMVFGVPSASAQVSRLTNGQITIGVDLAQGGTITELATPTSANVVNSWDLGRQVQQSYYAGPDNFGNPQPPWSNWAWNPVAAGDHYRNPSQVLQATNDGTTIYVKSVPKQWALNNVACECVIEQWITLDGASAHVRNRLTNARQDTVQYPAKGQELPAVYANGSFSRVVTYQGPAPYSNGPVTDRGSQWPAQHFSATERWAALVNASGWGVGVVSPDITRFAGGYCACGGPPGVGGPTDTQTGYISPQTPEIIDANIVYDYDYDVVLGTVAEIRAFAMEHRRDTRPDYQFTRDRQHFIYGNAEDAGWPIRGALRVKLDRLDAHLIGPEQWWDAVDVPKLYIRAAFQTKQRTAEVFWTVPGAGFSGSRRVAFPIDPDGRYHTYVVDLAASPLYAGTITGLRFDPVVEAEPGSFVDVASISWRPPEPSTDGGSPPIGDRRSPRLALRARGQRLSRRGVLVRARCDERCRLTVNATVGVRRGLRLIARARSLRADRWVRVRLRPSHRTLRRIRSRLRRGRSVTGVVRARAVDPAGNATRSSKKIRIVRRAATRR